MKIKNNIITKIIIFLKKIIFKNNFFLYLFIKIFFVLNYFFCFKNIKKIKKNIFNKKNNKNRNVNLIIADSFHALGDFIISLSVFENIKDFNFVVVIHKMYKEIIEKNNFKNLNFFYFENDIGGHYGNIMNEKEFDKKLISLNKEFIKIKNLKIKNIFIFSNHINIEHLSILSSIDYEKCFYVSKKKEKNNLKNHVNNFLFYPHWTRYFYFLNYFKRFNFNFFYSYEKTDNFSTIMIKMINHVLDKNFSYSLKKEYFNLPLKKNYKIVLTPSSSIKRKDINFLYSIILLNNLQKKINANFKIYVVGKTENDKKNFLNLSLCNFNSNIQFLDLIDKTTFLDLFKIVENSDFIITNDTFLLHLGSYYNKKTIVYINSNDKSYKNWKDYWFNYDNKNILYFILDEKIFSEKFEIDELYNNCQMNKEKIELIYDNFFKNKNI